VTLVTGASGALGRAVAVRFAAAGDVVVGTARSWKDRKPPTGTVPLEADLGQPEAAVRLVREVVERYGHIDVLAHMVGGFAGGSALPETPESVWEQMLAINFTAARRMIQAVAPVMERAGGGRVIVVGSKAGEHPAAGMAAYACSKAALHMLVRCAAEELREAGVTVNAVLPSILDTPVNRAAMPRADFSRWVKPEAVAEAIFWLASPKAAEISGALVPVYGRA